MMQNIWLIVGGVLAYFLIVSCTFFAARLAVMKGRSRAWGWLGFLLNIVGVIIVCFLPNKKGVTGETNPLRAVVRRLLSISPVAFWIVAAGIVVIIGGSLLASGISDYFDNRGQTAALIEEQEDDYICPSAVYGKVQNIFCADGSNYAVTESGDLFGWGKVPFTALDESGKLYQKVKKVCVAGDTCYLLMADGTLYVKGNNANSLIPGQSAANVADLVKVESDVQDVALCETACAILKKSGNLYVVGVNTYGQLGSSEGRVAGMGKKLAGEVAKVLVTSRSLYYMTKNGTVYGLGSNAYGQFGLGNKDVQYAPAKIAADCKDVAAGSDFLLLLKKDGTVWSAGNNCYGQLGRKTAEQLAEEKEAAKAQDPKEKPEEGAEEQAPAAVKQAAFGQVEGLEAVTAVDAAGGCAFARIDGVLYAWGDNHLGQLGVKKKSSVPMPEEVHQSVAQIAVSDGCTLILTEDGSLVAAGDRRNHQLGAQSAKSGFWKLASVKEEK